MPGPGPGPKLLPCNVITIMCGAAADNLYIFFVRRGNSESTSLKIVNYGETRWQLEGQKVDNSLTRAVTRVFTFHIWIRPLPTYNKEKILEEEA